MIPYTQLRYTCLCQVTLTNILHLGYVFLHSHLWSLKDSLFVRHICFSFMPLTFNTAQTCVPIQNTNIYELFWVTVTIVIHLAARFVQIQNKCEFYCFFGMKNCSFIMHCCIFFFLLYQWWIISIQLKVNQDVDVTCWSYQPIDGHTCTEIYTVASSYYTQWLLYLKS